VNTSFVLSKLVPIKVCIVKLNLFNYFEKKKQVALNKYEKAVERNNEIILHFATHPRHRRRFLSPNRNLQPN
jgi:proteasome lid subunit RPN8/RPN11